MGGTSAREINWRKRNARRTWPFATWLDLKIACSLSHKASLSDRQKSGQHRRPTACWVQRSFRSFNVLVPIVNCHFSDKLTSKQARDPSFTPPRMTRETQFSSSPLHRNKYLSKHISIPALFSLIITYWSRLDKFNILFRWCNGLSSSCWRKETFPSVWWSVFAFLNMSWHTHIVRLHLIIVVHWLLEGCRALIRTRKQYWSLTRIRLMMNEIDNFLSGRKCWHSKAKQIELSRLHKEENPSFCFKLLDAREEEVFPSNVSLFKPTVQRKWHLS